jgi:hypothetical protein
VGIVETLTDRRLTVDIRTAILKAAEHVERHPDDWNFFSIRTPTCGSQGCAIGWVAAYMDMSGFVHELCFKVFGVRNEEFYDRMRALGCQLACALPLQVAQGLRAYANKYHPAPTPNWQALATAPLPTEATP